MGARAATAQQDPIVIYRSVDGDGETFSLQPGSLARLRAAFPGEVHGSPRVFIAHETKADFEHVHGRIAPQIIQLLTGLTEDRLQRLGGVIFWDPVTERELPRAKSTHSPRAR